MIDKKGKLFGIINIIDLMVLLLIVAILAAGIYRFSGAYKQTDNIPAAANGEITMVTRVRLVPNEVVEQLKVGDKLVAKGAFQNAEITAIEAAPAQWVAWTSEGEGVYTSHPIWKDIMITIKDTGSPDSAIVRVGGQEARTGKEFILKTQTVEVPSVVYSLVFE